MLALGLALAIAILRDAGADAVLGLPGVQPRARRSQQYVLSWLEQVVTANRTESHTEHSGGVRPIDRTPPELGNLP